MKKIALIIGIYLLTFCSFTNVTHAELSNNDKLKIKVEKIFSTFIQSSEKKYSSTATYKKITELETKLSKIIHNIDQNKSNYIIYNTLLESSRDYIFKYDYKQKEIKKSLLFSKYQLSHEFTKKIIDKNEVFLEDGIWYTYVFTTYLSFPNNIVPNKKDLEYNKISASNDVLFLSNEGLLFVKDYKKIKLISDNIIYGIPNKNQFLEEVRDDKYSIQNETDNDFIKLKLLSKNLTKTAKNKQEKIDILYDYVLNNISYTQPIDLNDKKIFSGIQTYKNKNGVCEGYVKYFQYLLQFSGVEDVKSIRGYVVNAQDYPQIGHAWTKIGDYYYDPTFDDPLGQVATKKKNDYYYYKLPKDIFYTNRYDYGISNETLEKAPLSYREQYIKKKLVNVFPKYLNEDYNILRELKFRASHGLDYFDDITIDDFKNKYGFTKVNNFTYAENGKNYRITKYNFFTLSNNNDIRTILQQLNYNLENHKLLEWTDENGTVHYRLGFNIEVS